MDHHYRRIEGRIMTIKVIALLETLKIKSQVVLKIRQKKNNN